MASQDLNTGNSVIDIPDDAFRVLVTGFGKNPYYPFTEHSWLAVKPLHNTLLPCCSVSKALAEDSEQLDRCRPIHITALKVPFVYQAVLDIVPGLHAHPPQLPVVDQATSDDLSPCPPPTDRQYDFIFHIGIAGTGPLRIERQGHKSGYQMKDANGHQAMLTSSPKDFSRKHGPPEGIKLLDGLSNDVAGVDSIGPPDRGFGEGYDGPGNANSQELMTSIDVTALVQDLKNSGVDYLQDVYTSMDAGHHLADYVYYCSLSESKRRTKPYEKRGTQVLFMHCPPFGQPLTIEQTTDGIQRIIQWVCREIQRMVELQLEIEQARLKQDQA